MISKECVIYGLCDPRTGALRYVGKTTQPLLRRLKQHLRDKTSDHRGRWVQAILRSKTSPDIFVIEKIEEGNCWREAERHAVAYFKSLGCDLTNNALGGDGLGSFSEVTREKMARSARERDPLSRRFSDAARRTMSLSKLSQTRETREKLANAGRRISEETRQKRRNAAASISRETRQKMSQSAKNKTTLTPQLVRDIRTFVKEGDLSLAAIGRRLKVSASVVSRIKSGKTWSSVTF